MSTATHAAPTPGRLAGGRDRAPGLGALTRVELRKTYDTRAGFWLLVCNVALILLAAALTVFTSRDDGRAFMNVLDNAMQAGSVLLPIVGILLVTGEWSQRTAQVTFALVPRRGRVLLAKVAASLVLALAMFVLAFAVTALFTAIGGKANPSYDLWEIQGGVVLQALVFAGLSMLIGVAFGGAFLLSAGAIVASFALPVAVEAVTNLISGLDSAGAWINQGDTIGRMTGHVMSGPQWAQLGTAVLLWLVVPMVVGVHRFTRGEVR